MTRNRFAKTLFGGAALGAAAFGMSADAMAQRGRSAAPAFGQDAVIDFAGAGGIRDWHAENDSSIYLMDRAGHWYLALLSGPCWGLRFNRAVAFETDVSGRFDTFSTVRTRNHRCHVDRIVRSPRPAAKGGRGRD